jgi:hypothetical protein
MAQTARPRDRPLPVAPGSWIADGQPVDQAANVKVD